MAQTLMRISCFHSTVLSSPTISSCRPLCATMQDFKRCKWRLYTPKTCKIHYVLGDSSRHKRWDRATLQTASLLPHVFSLVCWVLEETFSLFYYRAVRSASTNKQSLQSLAAVSPSGEKSRSYHCEDPTVLGLCGPPASFGHRQCGGLCSATIRNRVCVVQLILVIFASPLIFHQF